MKSLSSQIRKNTQNREDVYFNVLSLLFSELISLVGVCFSIL